MQDTEPPSASLLRFAMEVSKGLFANRDIQNEAAPGLLSRGDIQAWLVVG